MATVILLLTWARPAHAQIFNFEDRPLPPAYTVSAHQIFYVYSRGQGSHSASSRTATVTFDRLVATVDGGQPPPEDHHGVQAALVPYAEFFERLQACSSPKDVKSGTAERAGELLVPRLAGVPLADVGVELQTVPLVAGGAGVRSLEATRLEVRKTGEYVLAVSNCGNFSAATISGRVLVRSLHGYLPGNEYYPMPFFAAMAAAYSLALLGWCVGLLLHFRGLLFVQMAITCIILIALLEALFSWVSYDSWNRSGERSELLSYLCLGLYTFKYVMAWGLVLLSSLGSGTVPGAPSRKTSVLVGAALFFFMVQQCVWKQSLVYRHSQGLPRGLLMLLALPGALVHALMFHVTLTALANLLSSLPTMTHDKTSASFRRARNVLRAALLCSFLVLCLQCLDIAGLPFPWEAQWVPAEGAPQAVFLGTLLAMMLVWWPSVSWNHGYRPQGQEPEGAEREAGETLKDAFEFPHDEEDVESEGMYPAVDEPAAGRKASFKPEPCPGSEQDTLSSPVPQMIGVPQKEGSDGTQQVTKEAEEVAMLL